MFDIVDLERSRSWESVRIFPGQPANSKDESGETGQVATAFLFQIQESESEQEGEARVSTAP